MTKKRSPDFSLDAALEDPGFTPRASDVAPLLDHIARKTAAVEPRHARAPSFPGEPERAPPRSAEGASKPGAGAFAWSSWRGLLRLPGPRRLRRRSSRFFCGRLGDHRRARSALCRGGARQAARDLGGRRRRGDRALAEALEARDRCSGASRPRRSAGERSAARPRSRRCQSRGEAATEPEEQARGKARLMAERGTPGRSAESAFEPAIEVDHLARVVLRRRGSPSTRSRMSVDPEPRGLRSTTRWMAPGRVEIALRGPPARLFAARTWLSYGFALEDVEVTGEEGALEEAADPRAHPARSGGDLPSSHARRDSATASAWASGRQAARAGPACRRGCRSSMS